MLMRCTLVGFSLWVCATTVSSAQSVEPLQGTEPLMMEGDITSELVAGVDRFLLDQLQRSLATRHQHWQRDFSSPQAYVTSVQPNRRRLAHILGVRDERVATEGLHLVGTTEQPAMVGQGDGFRVFAVRWPVIRDLHGEGLLLVPERRPYVADIVAIPDADQTPEMIAGLVEGVAAEAQFARRLAASGCRVVVPVLIDRQLKPRNGRATLTSREYLYRSAFELGRHLIGYEVQKVLAVVDWFQADAEGDAAIAVVGYGEGGGLALYAGALDSRIDVTAVSGYFDSRQTIWQQPIDRNVFGLLEQFGDAEVAALIAPRRLIVEAALGPELNLPGQGGAPAELKSPALKDVQDEVERALQLVEPLQPSIQLTVSENGRGPAYCEESLRAVLLALNPDAMLSESEQPPRHLPAAFDPQPRQERQIHELDVHNQWLLSESAYVRQQYMADLDTSSMEKFQQTIEPYRDQFRHQVIGHFDLPRKPLTNIRTRKAYDEPKWTGYEVVLDVFDDVIAYGILLMPKDLPAGERRPVVVCQHGLEGRPQDVVAGDHRAYHDFAAKLAEQGFITFAPQNLYIFGDRFRTLQRKANPIKKTLFSVIVPQHQQIVDWLCTLPQVDPDRIAFYGLSYGGKSAMRIPPLVDKYCLSICSADFNEWVWKNASTRAPYSYVWTGEYEIFEFDLGSTFNYAEMAALIAPRPFMVERGHFDGVAPDEAVGYEFAKVRNLYQARLGIGDRCHIEWFVGPHTINGVETFAFLKKHLEFGQ